ncbi:MAG: hypothetical protein ACM3WP_24040 [Acidobacteriota bacterium]
MVRCIVCEKPAFDLHPSAPLCWIHARTWAEQIEHKPLLEICGRRYEDAEAQILKEFLARVKAVRPRLGRKMRRLIENLDALTVDEAEVFADLKPEETEFMASILEEILSAKTGVTA